MGKFLNFSIPAKAPLVPHEPHEPWHEPMNIARSCRTGPQRCTRPARCLTPRLARCDTPATKRASTWADLGRQRARRGLAGARSCRSSPALHLRIARRTAQGPARLPVRRPARRDATNDHEAPATASPVHRRARRALAGARSCLSSPLWAPRTARRGAAGAPRADKGLRSVRRAILPKSPNAPKRATCAPSSFGAFVGCAWSQGRCPACTSGASWQRVGVVKLGT